MQREADPVGPILAIDTSSMTASVAIYQGQVLAEAAWHSGRSHSAQLLPTIDTLLGLAGVGKRDLAGIAVAIGPGSYSGLRVGVSTAVALALALNAEVVQVPTLDVMAWGTAAGGACEHSIRAAIDVGRGRYATARFRLTATDQSPTAPTLPHGDEGDGLVEHETAIESVAIGELLHLAMTEASLLVVDLDPNARADAEGQYGPRLRLASPSASLRRAGFLAELASTKIHRGELNGTATVEPIYLNS